MNTIWITIVIIGIATYATRCLPLFWLKPRDHVQPQSSWLNRLGPCLLASMAVAVIQPIFTQDKEFLETVAAMVGLVAAGGFMWLRRDPGIATLVGMIVYYVVSRFTFVDSLSRALP
jgi:branched-subunit amino acid transport protein